MTLAEKYRPKKFDDIVEQHHITQTLKKEITSKTIRPAYLFVGKSGSGKSTSSRILANSINAFVIEIDAASHNSAESMRNLLDTVKERPITADYTVVILDEAANFSKVAWDVLLLTIENPPKHLIFILCTTESQKVPKTIVNRCETFEFRNITKNGIVHRLRQICIEEGLTYEENALNIIATKAEGSMRQAINYLEQCSSSGITTKTVKEILMASSYDTYLNLLYAILDNDLKSITDIITGIQDADKFVSEFFSFVLNADVYTRIAVNMGIPDVFLNDLDKLSESDKEQIVALRKDLLELQFMGRNSPILKELLLATIMK